MSAEQYIVTFANGRKAYVTDTEGRPQAETIAGLRTIGDAWAQADIQPRPAPCKRGKNPTDCNPK